MIVIAGPALSIVTGVSVGCVTTRVQSPSTAAFSWTWQETAEHSVLHGFNIPEIQQELFDIILH